MSRKTIPETVARIGSTEPIGGRQHLMAIVDCEDTAAAANAASFLENALRDRLTGLLRLPDAAPPSLPSKAAVLLELGCAPFLPGADRCVDCDVPLTDANEPEGVIYIRARISGRWTVAPICSADYQARRETRLPRYPTRVLHE